MPLPLCRDFFVALLFDEPSESMFDGEDMPLSALPQPGDGWSHDCLGPLAKFALDLRVAELRLREAGRDNECVDLRRKKAVEAGWGGQYLKMAEAAAALSFDDWVASGEPTFALGLGDESDDANRPLNIDSLDQFVSVTAQWRLKDGIRPQIDAFKHGLADLCTSSAMWAFDADELRILLCGDYRVEWTREDLRTHLLPHGKYTIDSSPVQMLIDELVSMNIERRAQFLEFVTACPRLPPGGLKDVGLKISTREFASVGKTLPTAHTCFNELHLPLYEDADQLTTLLAEAMDNSQGISEFAA